jgi:hypothetical protein
VVFSSKKTCEFIVTCDCGCGYGLLWQAASYDDEKEEYYLSLVEPSWNAKQDNSLKSYFKRLFKAFCGKEYYLTEVLLKKSDILEFVEFLNKLTEKTVKESEIL